MRGSHRTGCLATIAMVWLVMVLGACGRSQTAYAVNGTDGTGDTGDTSDTGTGPQPPPPPDPTGEPPPPPPPPDCVVDLDCVVDEPCLSGRCEDGICVFEPRDADEDGYVTIDCGGEDCNDLNPNTHPDAPENCTDGDDNDCNGVSDCLDPACDDAMTCGCTPAPGGESCSNGVDDDCDTTVDCNDTDCLGTEACGCAASEIGRCGNGFDDDCDGQIDCDDSECAESSVCTCQAEPENCNNGMDDDCDLLIDCADPDCDGLGSCACTGSGSREVCTDGRDNDCDGAVDCADSDCRLASPCEMCTQEICNDQVDNNCDGRIDCADSACAFDPACAPTPEQCNNGLDDDLDGLIDCDDPDCSNVPVCKDEQSNCETAKLIAGSGTFTGDTTDNPNNTSGSCGGGAGEAVFYFRLDEAMRVVLDSVGTSFDSVLYVRSGSCESGREIGCDDDSGGSMWSARLEFPLLQAGTYYIFLDGYTTDPSGGPNEGPFQLNVEFGGEPREICDDGIDNDGDIYADCADPDCRTFGDCELCNGGEPATPEFGVEACTDGLDNDCDGAIDCADEDCSASDYYVTECCNGQDDNGNGISDDFTCRCQSDADCGEGQICYTHTSYTCGFPCTAFYGDVCPFVAPGSSCNDATDQCEF